MLRRIEEQDEQLGVQSGVIKEQAEIIQQGKEAVDRLQDALHDSEQACQVSCFRHP